MDQPLTPGTDAQVIEAWRCSYPVPLTLQAGERVSVGDRDTRWPGWRWCHRDDGSSGWVPERYLEPTGEPDRGRARRDYTGLELEVEVGERLVLLEEESGWLWASNSRGQTGWVPASHVRLEPDVTGPVGTSAARPAPDESSSLVVTVSIVDPYDPAAVALVEQLWEEEGTLYGNQGPCEFKPGDVSGPGCAFAIARRHGTPIGCGAIRPLAPGVAELKRMFVVPGARCQGVAGRLLTFLEETARGMGYDTIRLETGIRQPAAIRLYERAGYRRIPCYGRYAGDPLSLCFEKPIRATSGSR